MESRKNYYDIYFLHSVDGATDPFGPNGQDWTHTTTKDFITYSKQETAIPSKGGDSKEGWHSAWTGSVVTDSQGISDIQNEEPVAYFTDSRMMEAKQSMLVHQMTRS